MFIVSKRNMKVIRADGTPYYIKKGFIGTIPEDVAGHWLIKKAVEGGSVAVSERHTDTALEKADSDAEEKAKEADIRPDADKKTGKKKMEE